MRGATTKKPHAEKYTSYQGKKASLNVFWQSPATTNNFPRFAKLGNMPSFLHCPLHDENISGQKQGHPVIIEKSPTNVEQYFDEAKKPTAYSSLTTYHYDVTLTECFPKFYSAWVALVLFLDEWLLRLFESYCHQHMKALEKTKLELLYHFEEAFRTSSLSCWEVEYILALLLKLQ